MKARIKDFENIPEDEKCCSVVIERMKTFCGTVIEVEKLPFLQAQTCLNCGTILPIKKALMYSDWSFGIPIDCIDIDEGELHGI